MLVFLEGWYYVMELYFWLILGAILLISLTILVARPQKQKYEDEMLDLGIASGKETESDGLNISEPIIIVSGSVVPPIKTILDGS